MKLKKYIKNQISYAGWQIASLLGVIIFFVIILATLIGSYDSGYAGVGPIIGTIGMVIFGSTWLVLWITGIINAYKINSITKKSGVLVAFAIIPIPLIHIIIAIKEQKNILKNE